MRRSETQHFGSILQQYLNAIDIHGKLKEIRLIDAWPNVVGNMIAKKTNKLLIKKRVLFAYMSSSVAKNELLMLDPKGIVKALNEKAGAELIDDIVIR